MSLIRILEEGAAERKSLDKVQREVREGHSAIRELEGMPVHMDETREQLLAATKDAVYQTVPQDVYGRFRYVGPDKRLPIGITFSDLAFLFGEEFLVNAIVKRLEANGQAAGIRSEERAAKIKALRAKLDNLERAEELAILQLEDAGHVVLRREDARPDLLLEIWGGHETAKAV